MDFQPKIDLLISGVFDMTLLFWQRARYIFKINS